MNLKSFLLLILVVHIGLLNTSCKKQSECVAGTNGPVMVAVFPKVNGRPIFNLEDYRDTAFVKFNAMSLPGTDASNFDLVIAGNVGEDHVHIPNLKCGDYFIYVAGFDTSISKRVSGGLAVTLTETYGTEVDFEVPLSE